MVYFTFKQSGKNRYLVLRWKKRINGVPTIVKEVSVGTADQLAHMLQNSMDSVVMKSYSCGSTLSVLYMDEKIRLRDTINERMGHRDGGASPGDYMLLFIMSRLADPCSKNRMDMWMKRDYASTLFPPVSSQDLWNVMDRFSDEDMKYLMDHVKETLISMGYDFKNIFFDASNMYAFMGENDMAKKGHNKTHRYDLNQISYYIASNHDYIPLYFESYPGNVHDSKTFQWIVSHVPEGSTLIFDRGYNSKDNIDMITDRKYIGALKKSDHHDIMGLKVDRNAHVEIHAYVYGKDHRVILYHSQSLEERHKIRFMKNMNRVMSRVKRIMDTGDSDCVEKARMYLEAEHLNETILLPDMRINQDRMDHKMSMMGKNAIFTNIMDMDAERILELYRNRNMVEHCFRTINVMNLAFPLYHWTEQKIRVHMFFSLMAYLFLALIYNEVHDHDDTVSLMSTVEYMKDIHVNYAMKGKTVITQLECKSPESELFRDVMDLEHMIKA